MTVNPHARTITHAVAVRDANEVADEGISSEGAVRHLTLFVKSARQKSETITPELRRMYVKTFIETWNGLVDEDRRIS